MIERVINSKEELKRRCSHMSDRDIALHALWTLEQIHVPCEPPPASDVCEHKRFMSREELQSQADALDVALFECAEDELNQTGTTPQVEFTIIKTAVRKLIQELRQHLARKDG